jgi:hypothetical protein
MRVGPATLFGAALLVSGLALGAPRTERVRLTFHEPSSELRIDLTVPPGADKAAALVGLSAILPDGAKPGAREPSPHDKAAGTCVLVLPVTEGLAKGVTIRLAASYFGVKAPVGDGERERRMRDLARQIDQEIAKKKRACIASGGKWS